MKTAIENLNAVQSEIEDLEMQKRAAVEDERYDDAKAIKIKIENSIMTAMSMGKPKKQERSSSSKYEDRKIEDPDLLE